MHEILRSLPPSVIVLDLGCDQRSFDSTGTQARVVRLDREIQFPDQTFAAIISNHSLEHFDDLNGALREIGRAVHPQGALFIAVPDASTFCDKLYRWLARGGGHVNPFTSAKDLAGIVEQTTGLKHIATKPLFTSLSYLNRKNSPTPRPRRLILVGGGYEWSLFLFARLSRIIDRYFGTRLSMYGWALYFGHVPVEIDTSPNLNVCLRCGSGTPSAQLRRDGRGIAKIPAASYRCPQCGAKNPFADDEKASHRRYLIL